MKIEFFFTEGHKYTATNVFDIAIGVDAISYVRDVNPDLDGVVSTQTTTVSMDDLLYAVVHRAAGVQVIPGIFSKFEIVPIGAEVQKQVNIEREAQGVRNRQALRKVKKDIKNCEGFAARNAKRRAAYEESQPLDVSPAYVGRVVNDVIEVVKAPMPELSKAAKHVQKRRSFKK